MQTDINYYFKNMEEFPLKGFFEGLEYAWQPLEKVNAYLDKLLKEPDVRESRAVHKSEAHHFYGNYFIGEGTVIYNDVTVIGPVYIGRNCELMPGCIIRPYTILGDNCVVGHGAEVKHCVAMNGAKIQSMSFAGDSVIGKSARIGSGVIIANRNFNQENIKVKLSGGEKLDLNSGFFGCILGDNSRLGANSVTQPGTHIGPYTWVYPATSVRGFIPAQKRVYHEKPLLMEDNEILELKP